MNSIKCDSDIKVSIGAFASFYSPSLGKIIFVEMDLLSIMTDDEIMMMILQISPNLTGDCCHFCCENSANITILKESSLRFAPRDAPYFLLVALYFLLIARCALLNVTTKNEMEKHSI